MSSEHSVLPQVLAAFCSAAATGQASATTEYSRHLAALGDLSVAVAQAMPTDKYGYRPQPDSMNFGELMAHIATTNFQFCAGLDDAATPALSKDTGKDAVVRFLSDSFQYCSTVLTHVTDDQLAAAHDSPDGHLSGRDLLLAMYIHVAHHRGQAEIYLRANGIVPPSYRI